MALVRKNYRLLDYKVQHVFDIASKIEGPVTRYSPKSTSLLYLTGEDRSNSSQKVSIRLEFHDHEKLKEVDQAPPRELLLGNYGDFRPEVFTDTVNMYLDIYYFDRLMISLRNKEISGFNFVIGDKPSNTQWNLLDNYQITEFTLN